MGPISYTAASLFSACPRRYKAERIDGMRPPDTLPKLQGAFLHSVLEEYGKRMLENGEGASVLKADGIFESMWDGVAHGLPLTAKEDCRRLVAVAARFLSFNEETVVGLELRLAVDEGGNLVDWDAPDAAVRGIIDALEIQGDTLIVRDYKTGRLVDDPKSSKQLALYLALARTVHPGISKFIGKLYYPRFDAERVAEIRAETMAGALAWALDVRRKIGENLRGGEFEVWAETPGAACAECPLFWSCESRKKISGQELRVPLTENDAQGMVQRAEILERELSETREMLKLYIDANGPIEIGGLVADLKGSHRLTFPIKELLGVLARHGLDYMRYVNGNTKALKKAALKYPGLQGDLDAILDDKTSVKLDIRRIGAEQKIKGEEDEN